MPPFSMLSVCLVGLIVLVALHVPLVAWLALFGSKRQADRAYQIFRLLVGVVATIIATILSLLLRT